MKRSSKIMSFLLLTITLFTVSVACRSEPRQEQVVIKYEYAVTPAEGAIVDFHTDIQQQFIDSGAIDTPENIDGKPIDGNPFDSQNLETRSRKHDDWSLPNFVALTWEGETSDFYYVELSANREFDDNDIITYVTTETFWDVYNLFIDTEYYWRVSPDDKEMKYAAVYSFKTSDDGPRNIYLDGVTNVRDVGGMKLQDGSGEVRQGLLYRGGRFNLSKIDDDVSIFDDDPDYFRWDITEKGIETLTEELKVKTEIDLRLARDGEIGNMNDARIPSVKYVNIPCDYRGGIIDSKLENVAGGENNLTRQSNPQRIKEVFEILADEDNYPVYFHCNIGTDRTGVVAYLVGALIGMDEQTLYKHYVFSNFGNIAGSVRQSGRQSGTIINGYGATVNSYPGDTLAERTENALKDICGLSSETLQSVVNILVEYYEN